MLHTAGLSRGRRWWGWNGGGPLCVGCSSEGQTLLRWTVDRHVCWRWNEVASEFPGSELTQTMGRCTRTRPKCKNTCASTAVPLLRRHHPRSVVKLFLPSALPLYWNPCCLSLLSCPWFFFFSFLARLTIQDVVGWCPEATLRRETLSCCCSWKAASGIQGGLLGWDR